MRSVVVMIPAFNEEKSIGAVIKAIPRKIGKARVKVLVVDDGSADKTATVSRKAGADRVVSHRTNKGLGTAFRTGLEESLKMGADVIVNIDADGQFNPRDIPKIANPVLGGKADVVTCSRFLDKRLEPEMPWVKKFGNGIFTSIINFFTKKKFTDTQCGFRAYSRETALRTILFGKFTYTQEVLLDLSQKGFRIIEVAAKVKGQRKGKSRIVSHWWDYGAKALIIIVRCLRDYKPLKFFGAIGIALFALGGISALFLLYRLLEFHKISPYLWVVYMDVVLIILGFLLMILALLADMMDRQRKIQEEILYRLKKAEIGKEKD
ncbi:MAG: glycosyltransferase [archaeon]